MLRHSVVACARGRLQAPEPHASSGGLAHVFRQLHALKAGSAAPRAHEQFNAVAIPRGAKSGRGRTPHPKGKPAVAELLSALDTAAVSASAAEFRWDPSIKTAVVDTLVAEKEEFIMHRTLARFANVPVHRVVYASFAKQSVALISQRRDQPFARSVTALQPFTSPHLAACVPGVKVHALTKFLSQQLGGPTTGPTLLLIDDSALVEFLSGASSKVAREKMARMLCINGELHVAFVRAGRNPASPLHDHSSREVRVANLPPVSESIASHGQGAYIAQYVPKKDVIPQYARPPLHSPLFLPWATAEWERQTSVTIATMPAAKRARGAMWRSTAKNVMMLHLASLPSADVVIYTDASVPGAQGWNVHRQMGTAATIAWPDGQVTVVGASAGRPPLNTGVATAIAEMQAIQNALAHVLPQLKPGSRIALVTDSANCMQKIMQGPTIKKLVPHSLFKMLLCDLPEAQSTLHLVHMHGHTGVHGNVMADLLALQFSVFDCSEEARERRKSFLATIPRTGAKRAVSENTNQLGKIRQTNGQTLEMTQELLDKVRNPPDGDNEKQGDKETQ